MKNFVDLKNYLIKEIKPQENYQYFIFKELLNSGGQISYDELADRYDTEYENTNKTNTKTILKDAPTSALSRHGYITSDKNNVYVNYNEEPLYYKETISWILEKCLDHWTKNKSIKDLEFKEGIIKTDKEVESFCYENNIPRDLVEKIILSINRGEKQIILDGPPGTGKTYLIKKIIQFLSNGDSISDLVQFHPSYGYEEFVEGLRPTSKNGIISFEVVSGKLISLIEKGGGYSFPIALITANEMSNKKSIINKTEFKRNELTNAIDLKNELTFEDFNKVFKLQKIYSSENTEDMKLRDQYVKKELPKKLESFLHKGGYKNYKVQGSGGVGRKAAVPWVRIYREEFSKSAQEGYYLVYLFDATGEKAYLSLNHASTNRETFTSINDEEAVKYVNDARELIKPLSDDIIDGQNKNNIELNDKINFVWDIDLASKLSTPKAYEKTHIFGYEINKSHEYMSFNLDLINALELLEVIYQNLDYLENFSNIPSLIEGFSKPEILTELNINELPESPGVHLIYYKDSLLYVGETGNTQRRITEHMRSHHASGDTFIKHSQKKFGLNLSNDEDKSKFDQLRSNMTVIYKLTEEKEALKNKLIDELKPEYNQKLASVDISELYDDTNISRGGEVILQALKNLGGRGKLIDIYKQVNLIDENIPESSVRRDLQKYSHGSKYYGKKFPEIFRNISSGFWEILGLADLEINSEKDVAPNKLGRFESFGSHNFLLIDEINRGNLPKIFGELLNAFEYRDENISLQYSDKPLSVPSNLIFLGTMNSTDKSVGRMDAAIRRRFDFIHVEPNYEVLERFYENKELHVPNLIDGLEVLNELIEKDLGKHCLIGHTFFMKTNESPFTYRDIEKIWERKIYPLLEEYFLDDITKLEIYKSYKYFWEEIKPANNHKNSKKRYNKKLLSEHLFEISNEHKELQLSVEKWGEDVQNMNIWPGYINANFRSGGRTLIYTVNSKGLSERNGKYHLFKMAGNGNIVLPLHALYSKDHIRVPFDSEKFRALFESKLINYFQEYNIKINTEKFFSKSKPSFDMKEIIKTESLEAFIKIWDWVIKEINNSSGKYE